jgi:hypothetical protein
MSITGCSLRIGLPLRGLLIRQGALIAEAASQRTGMGIHLDVQGDLVVAERELIERPISENVPEVEHLSPFQ